MEFRFPNSNIRKLEVGIQLPGVGCWKLDFQFPTFNFRNLDLNAHLPEVRFQLPTSGSWKLGNGNLTSNSLLLEVGFQLPTSGGWSLEIGTPISTFWNLDFNFHVPPRNFQPPEVGSSKLKTADSFPQVASNNNCYLHCAPRPPAVEQPVVPLVLPAFAQPAGVCATKRNFPLAPPAFRGGGPSRGPCFRGILLRGDAQCHLTP